MDLLTDILVLTNSCRVFLSNIWLRQNGNKWLTWLAKMPYNRNGINHLLDEKYRISVAALRDTDLLTDLPTDLLTDIVFPSKSCGVWKKYYFIRKDIVVRSNNCRV